MNLEWTFQLLEPTPSGDNTHRRMTSESEERPLESQKLNLGVSKTCEL